MKFRTTIYVLGALLIIGMLSCNKNKSKLGELTVECVPLTGETVDVSGMKLELHTSAAFDFPILTAELSGSTVSSTAQFIELETNTYYCRAWKDVNANQIVDAGDIYAFHVDPIDVKEDDELSIKIEAYLIQ